MDARVWAVPENVRFAVGQISAGVLPEMSETLGNDTSFCGVVWKNLDFFEIFGQKATA